MAVGKVCFSLHQHPPVASWVLACHKQCVCPLSHAKCAPNCLITRVTPDASFQFQRLIHHFSLSHVTPCSVSTPEICSFIVTPDALELCSCSYDTRFLVQNSVLFSARSTALNALQCSHRQAEHHSVSSLLIDLQQQPTQRHGHHRTTGLFSAVNHMTIFTQSRHPCQIFLTEIGS